MQPLYRAGYLRQLLAKDPRTNLLDVEVRIVGDRIFLAGTVESPVIRAAAEEVVRQAVPPEMEVVNAISVTTFLP